MIGAIRSGKDLHCYTVALMYGENYEEVYEAKEQKERDKATGVKKITDRQKLLLLLRQAAKNTGFGLIYGIGPMKLSTQLVEAGVEGFKAPKNEQELGTVGNFFLLDPPSPNSTCTLMFLTDVTCPLTPYRKTIFCFCKRVSYFL